MRRIEKLVWPRIAVVGAGAVGCYFGGMLARAGASVQLIGRRATVEAIAREQLTIHDAFLYPGSTTPLQERIRITARTDMEAIRGADVILLCVKTIHSESAAVEVSRCVAPHTIVLSIQNGVDNVERIFAASGISALPSVIYISVSMSGPAQVTKAGHARMVLGVPENRRAGEQNNIEVVARLAKIFAASGVSCQVSNNITGELWLKLLWNCAGNAVTALGHATYGQISANALARKTMLAAALEVKRVAEHAGIRLPEVVLTDELIRKVHDAGDLTSSTAQDVIRRRKTEIDSLNGYVVSRAKELGVEVPVNQTLYSLVKLLESSYSEASHVNSHA